MDQAVLHITHSPALPLTWSTLPEPQSYPLSGGNGLTSFQTHSAVIICVVRRLRSPPQPSRSVPLAPPGGQVQSRPHTRKRKLASHSGPPTQNRPPCKTLGWEVGMEPWPKVRLPLRLWKSQPLFSGSHGLGVSPSPCLRGPGMEGETQLHTWAFSNFETKHNRHLCIVKISHT